MTPGDGREHPDVLPWYVTGRLDPDERARVEAHLRDCAECRAEVEALVSMRRTHLAYRGDLEHLERMAEPEGAVVVARTIGTPSRFAPWAWALLGAAAATIVFLALPRESRQPHEPPLVAARPVVLLPARRDAAEAPALSGPGPWSLQVVLPLGSPEGEYIVRIARDGGGAVDGAEIPATVAAGGPVTLVLRALPGPGRYTMTLVPPHIDSAAPAPEAIYTFELKP